MKLVIALLHLCWAIYTANLVEEEKVLTRVLLHAYVLSAFFMVLYFSAGAGPGA